MEYPFFVKFTIDFLPFVEIHEEKVEWKIAANQIKNLEK